MSKIRLGVIGLGKRGYSWIKNEFVKFDNVEVTAVCDLYIDRVERAQNCVQDARGIKPFGTQAYEDVIVRDDVDIVMILSAWDSIPILQSLQ